MFNCVD